MSVLIGVSAKKNCKKEPCNQTNKKAVHLDSLNNFHLII